MTVPLFGTGLAELSAETEIIRSRNSLTSPESPRLE